MVRYKNLHGSSGVIAYEIGPDSIAVQFKNGYAYLYTYESTGKRDVEVMKDLATRGMGLSTYVTTYVRERYAKKWLAPL